MCILALLGYSILFVYDFVPLYKQKLWRDLWVCSVLGLFSLTIIMLFCFDIRIPNPAKPIRELVTSIFGE